MNEVPVALVTGGSRGIGRGIALRLAKDGLTVVINSRTADPADAPGTSGDQGHWDFAHGLPSSFQTRRT
jgi:NAD(P)-dependent dehydrogenase (short-subunit alcohol dehydrogenase family)